MREIAGPAVAVVGGGIAGCALATVLAREGVEVLVLERRHRYDDRVRGENLHPWGVAEAQRLGLFDVLIGAGAHLADRVVSYPDDPNAGEPRPTPLGELIDGVPGELNLGHPAACAALADAAVSAGATLRHGVSHLEVTPGSPPTVSYRLHGARQQITPRLVVGADGRSSRVRRQIGVELEQAPPPHMVAGLLVDDLDVDERTNVVGIGPDVWMVTFPQGGGRARVYLCASTDEPQRFAGPEGPRRFLETSAIDPVPDRDAWRDATPAGPCRTFPADDTWTDRPFADGVVLIGDAAGYNNPLIGQGLALALRDVHSLSSMLLAGTWWGDGVAARYGSERAERLRRVRFLARLYATSQVTFGEEGRELRRRIRASVETEPALAGIWSAIFTGPDSLDPAACSPESYRRCLGLGS